MEYKLEYIQDDELKEFYLHKELITIGKISENDLVLKDQTVSRKHCQILLKKKNYLIVDLGSTNGSFVNGQRVSQKELHDGDRITLGRTILTFVKVSRDECYEEASDQRISLIVPLQDIEKSGVEAQKDSELGTILNALTKLSKNLIALYNLEDCFKKLSELIFDFIAPEKILIFNFDQKQNDLNLKFSFSKKKDCSSKISKTIALKAIHDKVAILSSNAQKDERFDSAQSIVIYGITSAISVPIWSKDSIYGLIYVDSTSFNKMFKPKDLEMLSLLANFAGIAIEALNNQEKLNHEKKLRARLERYHSPAVVTRLLQSPEENINDLTNYKLSEATVLFLDLVQFTARSEKMTPIGIGLFLNRFFTEMTEVIFKYNGTLDKFIGDAIMAVFGAPIFFDDHAEKALYTALEMIKRIEELNMGCRPEELINVRIGINSGKIVAGDFGSPKRIEYTVLGQTVNIASRIESQIARSDEIVVGPKTYELTKNIFNFLSLGEKSMKGVSQKIKLYKLLGVKDESN